ncbi:hypothetical protein FGO68_gene11339 [Halteria grandinella]|uniref:Uncharacterized protein n=1 Tax=Halteria grandinella TaxID=5974 RepID=A0A8J8SZT9_HALGN|nr:hypothetical protein FGO68_gene11339 [Halteria grandinella]
MSERVGCKLQKYSIMERSSHQGINHQSSGQSSGPRGLVQQSAPHQYMQPKSSHQEDEQSSSSSSSGGGAGAWQSHDQYMVPKQFQQHLHAENGGSVFQEGGGAGAMPSGGKQPLNIREQMAQLKIDNHHQLIGAAGDSGAFLALVKEHYPHMPEATYKQLEMLNQVLDQYAPEDIRDLFILHVDPRQNGGPTMTLAGVPQGKLILTEPQFNLVKKVYAKSFSTVHGRFNLSDNELVIQFFMNIKHLYSIIQRCQMGDSRLMMTTNSLASFRSSTMSLYK